MCAGMRIAKLEVKLIMALFFLTFEFEVVDSAGEFPKSLPQSDFNEFKRVRKALSSGPHRPDIRCRRAQFEMIRAISSSRGSWHELKRFFK